MLLWKVCSSVLFPLCFVSNLGNIPSKFFLFSLSTTSQGTTYRLVTLWTGCMPVESPCGVTCPILTTLHLAQVVTLKTIFCNKFKAFVLHFHITTKSALLPNQLPIKKKFICFVQLASLPFCVYHHTSPGLLHFSSVISDTRHHPWWAGRADTQFCINSQSRTQCPSMGSCRRGHLQLAPSITLSMCLQLPTAGRWEFTLMLLLWFCNLAASIPDLTNQAQTVTAAALIYSTGGFKESLHS